MPSTPSRFVVTDASVLINLTHVDRLALLSALPGLDFVVTDEVVAEVVEPEQAAALQRALGDGHLRTVSLNSTEELGLYATHQQVMGSGEASCLALAEVHGYLLACDERRKFLATAVHRLGPGRVVNTPGLYLIAIQCGVLTVEQADEDKIALETQRFKMRFASFRDVLPTSTVKKTS